MVLVSEWPEFAFRVGEAVSPPGCRLRGQRRVNSTRYDASSLQVIQNKNDGTRFSSKAVDLVGRPSQNPRLSKVEFCRGTSTLPAVERTSYNYMKALLSLPAYPYVAMGFP